MRSRCNNCNDPLDAPGPASVICAGCGAVQYTKPDIDEFAAAIVDGRTDAASPSAIAGWGAKVGFEPAAPADYRSPGRTDQSRGELTLRLPRWRAWSAARLLVVAAVLAGLGYGLLLAVRGNFYLPLVLAAIPGLIYAAVRLATELDPTLVLVVDGKLLVRPHSRVPRKVVLPADQVVRLFVTPLTGAYALFARTANNPRPRLLVRRIRRPEVGWYLARQVEHALGIADRPPPRDASQPSPPSEPFTRVWGQLLRLVFLPVIVGTPLVGLWVLGAELAELDVRDERQERPFEARQPGPVYFTADVEFSDYEWKSNDVPRSLQIRIQVQQQDEPIQDLSCDPFEVARWWDGRSTLEGKKRGRHISFWGPMDDCTATLPAGGPFTLHAWREWKPDMPRIGFVQTAIAMRQSTGALPAGLPKTLLLLYALSWPLLVVIPFPIWVLRALAAKRRATER